MGCHFLLQGIFPTQGSNPPPLMSPALAGRFFTASAAWAAQYEFKPNANMPYNAMQSKPCGLGAYSSAGLAREQVGSQKGQWALG